MLTFLLFVNIPIYGQETNPVCNDLLQTGQLETAFDCYHQEYNKYPNNPLINLRLCQILETTGRVNEIEPYISKLDSSSTEARKFMEYLSTNYQTLKIELDSKVDCPLYFAGRAKIEFVPPSELDKARADHLSSINRMFKPYGDLYFRKIDQNTSITEIPYFPIITDAPLPYTAMFSENSYNFNFNFLGREALYIDNEAFDSVYCIVPDSLVEIQLEIDDPDYEVSFKNLVSMDTSLLKLDQNIYFIQQGEMPEFYFQKKGRPTLGKKYFVITSVILTAAMLLLQR